MPFHAGSHVHPSLRFQTHELVPHQVRIVEATMSPQNAQSTNVLFYFDRDRPVRAKSLLPKTEFTTTRGAIAVALQGTLRSQRLSLGRPETVSVIQSSVYVFCLRCSLEHLSTLLRPPFAPPCIRMSSY